MTDPTEKYNTVKPVYMISGMPFDSEAAHKYGFPLSAEDTVESLSQRRFTIIPETKQSWWSKHRAELEIFVWLVVPVTILVILMVRSIL
jgi:hypothetical protein